MEKNQLTNRKALEISLIVSIGATAITLVIFGIGWSSLFFIPFFIATLPFSIIGALIAKYFATTKVQIWLGAVIGAILGYWLFFSIASNMSFD